MKRIIKTVAPESFVTFITNSHYDKTSLEQKLHAEGDVDHKSIFDNLKRDGSYDDLKQKLHEEQGYVCCYCCCRIPDSIHPKVVTEHLKPKSVHKELVAEYTNLLRSCDGGEDQTGESKNRSVYPLHCDKQKGDREIDVTPLDEDCESLFVYTIDGHIKGLSDMADQTIKILNLDCNTLVNRRKLAIASYIYESRRNGTILPDEDLKIIQSNLLKKDIEGKYDPFFFPVVKAIDTLLR